MLGALMPGLPLGSLGLVPFEPLETLVVLLLAGCIAQEGREPDIIHLLLLLS